MATSYLLPFVKNQLPDFVAADHPTFRTFMEAYYEWMEIQNTEQTDRVKELFKMLPNPGAIVNSAEVFRDVDETIDQFLIYFQNEVIPIALEGQKTETIDKRFIIKRVRDLYLSKGTPRSFKLLFRMLFREEIDIFIPKHSILEASEGKYLNFTTCKAKVVDGHSQLSEFVFDLASIVAHDSDRDVALIADAQVIGLQGGQPVYNFILNGESDIPYGRNFRVIDPVDPRRVVTIRILAQIGDFKVLGGGSNYRPGDYISIRGSGSPVDTRLYVEQVTNGQIDRVLVRNRGQFYSVGDTINFFTDNSLGGVGASASITGVDQNGRITEIDGTLTRTGINNNGYPSDDFEESIITITNKGQYNILPKTEFVTINNSNPRQAVGAQVFPISDTIGQIVSVNLIDTGAFDVDSEKDTDFYTAEIPLTFATVSETKFDIGSTIEFQWFKAEPEFFTADSEFVSFNITVPTGTFYVQVTTSEPVTNGDYYLDSDGYILITPANRQDPEYYDSDTGDYQPSYRIFARPADTTIPMPVSFNLNTFEWVTKRIDLFKNDTQQQFINRWLTDPDFVFVTKGNIFTDSDTDTRLHRLDQYHFDKLSTYDRNDSEIQIKFTREPHTFKILDSDNIYDYSVGRFISTGFGGQIYSTNTEGTQYTLINQKATTSDDSDGLGNLLTSLNFPTDSDIDSYNDIPYSIIRATQIDPRTGKVITLNDFPVSTNVSQYDRASGIEITPAGAALSQKRFINEDGFLNSLSGGVLRDNYIYSNFSYIIQTTIPINDWRDRIKTLLHPAGMYMFSELNVDTDVQAVEELEAESQYHLENINFSFDSTYDHYDDTPRGGIITADNIRHDANPFNVFTTVDRDTGNANGTYLTADSYFSVLSPTELSQAGNAFWDLEPVGMVRSELLRTPDTYTLNDSEGNYFSKVSTQDSDNNGFIKNTFTYYDFKKYNRQDFYKGPNPTLTRSFTDHGRYNNINVIGIVEVNYQDIINQRWRTYDSDPNDLYIKWTSHNEQLFTAINYTAIATRMFGDPAAPSVYRSPANRNQQLAISKARDFNTAMQEDGSLSYTVGLDTYTDYDAYEIKWNIWNNNRDTGAKGTRPIGWRIPGYSSVYQNIAGNNQWRWRYILDQQNRYNITKTPKPEVQFGRIGVDNPNNTAIWNEYYLQDFINDPTVNLVGVRVEPSINGSLSYSLYDSEIKYPVSGPTNPFDNSEYPLKGDFKLIRRTS